MAEKVGAHTVAAALTLNYMCVFIQALTLTTILPAQVSKAQSEPAHDGGASL